MKLKYFFMPIPLIMVFIYTIYANMTIANLHVFGWQSVAIGGLEVAMWAALFWFYSHQSEPSEPKK